jgi:hypothetical protein
LIFHGEAKAIPNYPANLARGSFSSCKADAKGIFPPSALMLMTAMKLASDAQRIERIEAAKVSR